MLEALLMSLHQLAHPTTLYEMGAIFGLRPERISEATNAFTCFIHSETNEVGKLRDLKLWAHREGHLYGQMNTPQSRQICTTGKSRRARKGLTLSCTFPTWAK